MNNITYVEPKVPSLYTALSVNESATNPIVYGEYANAHVLNHQDVVEIVINNFDSGGHPIHMHGHNFQFVERSAAGAGVYGGTPKGAPAAPIRRDVIKVNAGGYLVYRFRADNPDKCTHLSSALYNLLTTIVRVWGIHCHIDWHLSAGFFATIIEAPLQLQAYESVPADQFQVCKDQGLPYQGNAAANTKNYTDLDGANDAPPVHNRGWGSHPLIFELGANLI